MDIKAIAFDVNGTLIEIRTEDDMEASFRAIGHFLTYQGIDLRRHQVRDLYFLHMKQQQRESTEEFPEFDAVRIWRTIVQHHMTEYTRALPAEQLAQLPLFLAEMYRGITRRRLELYPHVLEVLDVLRTRFRLGIVSDGQSSYARGELHKVGLTEYFDPVIISGDFGFRKPDRRLFQFALDGMGAAAENTLYIGNDMHRDIYGAREAGLTTVMFDSDQGTKEYRDCAPDHSISDWRQLLDILE
jgi:putative hydrolase of the HAD superfamily